MASSTEIHSNIKEAVEETINTINEKKINTPTQLISYLSSLLWSIGCSIEQIPEEEANDLSIRRKYLEDPQLGNALCNLALDLDKEWLEAAKKLQGDTD